MESWKTPNTLKPEALKPYNPDHLNPNRTETPDRNPEESRTHTGRALIRPGLGRIAECRAREEPRRHRRQRRQLPGPV